MKKFSILFIALFSVNVASGQRSSPALSLDAPAQNKHRISKVIENIRSGTDYNGKKPSNNFSEMNLEQAIKNQTPEQRELIQIFDSVYQWRWDTLSIGWKIKYKFLNMIYDAHNNLISYIGQSWNGSIWVNLWQYTYTFDANNNQTSELYQDWNGSVWMNTTQQTSTYDATNNLISEIYQNWNGSSWDNSYKYTNTYDANDNLICELGKNWNGSTWENSTQDIYTYDANDNQTSALHQIWNTSTWLSLWQYTYTFDANNFSESDSHKDLNNNGTVKYGDSTYYYFHIVGINNLKAPLESISVYPNPTSTSITIETITKGQLSILNLNGQQLLQQEITEPTTTIDVSTLPGGVYVVKAVGKKRVQVGKFIKQ